MNEASMETSSSIPPQRSNGRDSRANDFAPRDERESMESSSSNPPQISSNGIERTTNDFVVTFDESWLNSKKQKLESLERSPSSPSSLPLEQPSDAKCCIRRVSPMLVDIRPNSFNPQHVSIGPYHHGKSHLLPMEDVKWRILHEKLQEKRKEGKYIDHYLNQLKDLAAEARSCYADLPPNIDGRDFVMMLLLDSCFIIDLLINKRYHYWYYLDESSGKTIQSLWADLLKLENQLPFFLLYRVFNLFFASAIYYYDDLWIEFFQDSLGALLPGKVEGLSTYHIHGWIAHHENELQKNARVPGMDHLLDICVSFLPRNHQHWGRSLRGLNMIYEKFNIFTKLQSKTEKSKLIPCATKLEQVAGIKFRPRKKAVSSIFDVEFSNGVVEIPPIVLKDTTATVFLNSVALESHFPQRKNCDFSAYVVLMDMLISTEKDVTLLCEEKIIHNDLMTEAELVQFFKGLAKVVSVDETRMSILPELRVELNKHYRDDWRRIRTDFITSYFKTPLLFISTLGGVILILLTFLQTIFTILSYAQQSSSPPSSL